MSRNRSSHDLTHTQALAIIAEQMQKAEQRLRASLVGPSPYKGATPYSRASDTADVLQMLSDARNLATLANAAELQQVRTVLADIWTRTCEIHQIIGMRVLIRPDEWETVGAWLFGGGDPSRVGSAVSDTANREPR